MPSVNGGDRLDHGVDTDDNTILDSSEVLGSIYLCSGICLGETVSYTKSFTTLGTTTTPLLDQGKVQLTGSPGDIGILNLNGLGVTGGGVDSSVDSSEVLTLTFVNLAVSDQIYNVASTGNSKACCQKGRCTQVRNDKRAICVHPLPRDARTAVHMLRREFPQARRVRWQ